MPVVLSRRENLTSEGVIAKMRRVLVLFEIFRISVGMVTKRGVFPTHLMYVCHGIKG